MCTNLRYIKPLHSRRGFYVKCGHCKACLQEKAASRVRRINDTMSPDLVCYMVTLTYSPGTCPYVLRSDAYDFVNGRSSSLDIRRDCTVRKVRKVTAKSDYTQVYRFNRTSVVLDSVEFDLELSTKSCLTLSKTKDLKHEHGKIGVVYYKDYQHFIARLRLNLKRHYNYEGKIFVYACDEYGTKSYRPHFHLLIFIEKSAATFFRAAVCESWPFSNLNRFERAIERCYKGASYVASYVNQSSNFPLFLKAFFKVKHSYSKGFGLNNPNYSFDKMLQKIQRGNLSFVRGINQGGITRFIDVPIPARVINRFFPLFKGYFACPPCSLSSYMRRIYAGDWQVQYWQDADHSIGLPYSRPVYCLSIYPYDVYQQDGIVHLNNDDLCKIQVRLINAYHRVSEHMPSGFTFDDYIELHKSVWRVYKSTVLRLHLLNPDVPMVEKYDNWDFVKSKHLDVVGVDVDSIVDIDPNKYRTIVANTAKFRDSFNEHIKHRDVANAIYMAAHDDCEL